MVPSRQKFMRKKLCSCTRECQKGKSSCFICLEKARKKHADRVASGMCSKCGLASATKLCDACKRKNRDMFVLRVFALSPDDVVKMESFQKGVCFICGRPPKKHRLNIDHRHSDGFI